MQDQLIFKLTNMKLININDNAVIHCSSKEEFDRIKHLPDFPKEHIEYLNWDVYGSDTVLYPQTGEYGAIYGLCDEENYNVISSEEIN